MPLSDFKDSFPLLCNRLEQAKRNGRTGQAYLFLGDDPVFLENFAMAWAQTAACTGNTATGEACGHCRPCDLFQRGCYPECLVLRPQSKSRQITVESMRQFEYDIGLATTPGLLKVGIIVEAECLGEEAQNAFLKTLEEPPPNTLLLLLTVNSRKLLPTIRSRCQTISLLRNRQNYDLAVQKGLFTILANLKRGAGAGVGLKTSAQITSMFAALHKDAENLAEETKDHRWDDTEDAKIKKQLEEEYVAKVEAEYVRLREMMLSALTAWYLQRFLICQGVRRELLPHKEMLEAEESVFASPPKPEEAEEDIGYAEELVSCIKANVDERLALDVFCLSVSEKKPKRAKS
ncbi:MAG: hypothetical protein K5787_14940 [Lentisphaeria bacterium]|nr:hypothetical protein [Victivallales bacterium]MCR4575053.1 hypothetical protein [Lentisphaeria bacterium]